MSNIIDLNGKSPTNDPEDKGPPEYDYRFTLHDADRPPITQRGYLVVTSNFHGVARSDDGVINFSIPTDNLLYVERIDA